MLELCPEGVFLWGGVIQHGTAHVALSFQHILVQSQATATSVTWSYVTYFLTKIATISKRNFMR